MEPIGNHESEEETEYTYHFSLYVGEKLLNKYALAKRHISIGRNKQADIVIPNGAISRQHAVIKTAGGVCGISDCGSRNGIKVRGQRIEGQQTLRAGETAHMGKFELRFDSAERTEEENEAHFSLDLAAAFADDEPSTTESKKLLESFNMEDTAQYRMETVMLQNPMAAAGKPVVHREPPRFQLHHRGKMKSVVRMTHPLMTLGSGPQAHIPLAGFLMPKLHSHILHRGKAGIWIEMQASKPPLLVNGQPAAKARLRNGAEIQIGTNTIKVRF